jgi:hypothetical protein
LALRMQADGLTVAADIGDRFESRLATAFGRMTQDVGLRSAISARLAELCDGLGADRVTRFLMELG